MMNVAFDIGGVISKYPEQFKKLIIFLRWAQVQVYVITDMHNVDDVHEMLVMNGFDMIPKGDIYCADYKQHGEGCKAELLRELEVDLFFDDFMGYMMLPGDTIQCLVMPNPHKPYWHPSWKVKDESDFGRRVYTNPWFHASYTVNESPSTSTSDEEATTLVVPGRNGATRSPSKKAPSRSSSSQKTKSSRATKRGSKNSRS